MNMTVAAHSGSRPQPRGDRFAGFARPETAANVPG
jgi:hypothetical protein